MPVFLRILDYYTGILFLTTNRPGSLDEAFKSRIHHMLHYPPLDKEQTLDIWSLNLRRLQQIEENQNWQGLQQAPIEIDRDGIMAFAEGLFANGILWNGRQIRNAFQVARSVAFSDAHAAASLDKPWELKRRLEVRHFRLIANVSEDFERYRQQVFSGMTDADLAREMEQRADDFRGGWNAPQVARHHERGGLAWPPTPPETWPRAGGGGRQRSGGWSAELDPPASPGPSPVEHRPRGGTFGETSHDMFGSTRLQPEQSGRFSTSLRPRLDYGGESANVTVRGASPCRPEEHGLHLPGAREAKEGLAMASLYHGQLGVVDKSARYPRHREYESHVMAYDEARNEHGKRERLD
jgi:hypothetical protein